ncbi:hypothetical protein [Saccharomonospora sp. CUA-673]|uniref:hypothetical protein n=1 Tax=Saccharomonospora sp. CUA-673 TaxID=1904969 RepID=UPI001115207F|nr:hypothetical protein [Saccharomonospora sp. CUA-673]
MGHSMGGFIAPLAADALGARHLVLCSAMVPLPGETVDEWWDASGFTAAELDHPDDEVALFLHDVDAALIAEAPRHATDVSGSLTGDPFPLDAWPATRRRSSCSPTTASSPPPSNATSPAGGSASTHPPRCRAATAPTWPTRPTSPTRSSQQRPENPAS